jgi:hypothetical protein
LLNNGFISGNTIPDMSELEILDITRRLLQAIHDGDSEAYRALCAPEVSCFETDVAPYRIDGVDFHLDLIQAMKRQDAYEKLVRFDLLSPRVQLYPGFAVITYTRLMTYQGEGNPYYKTSNETRVFAKESDGWKMIHFHRSETSSDLMP